MTREDRQRALDDSLRHWDRGYDDGAAEREPSPPPGAAADDYWSGYEAGLPAESS